MAGVKGRSGGARKGTGGARPGAGRKPAPPPEIGDVAGGHKDSKSFLLSVMNNKAADPRLRMEAAKAMLPFEYQKLGDGGKKEGRQAAAGRVSAGRFAPAAPPRLVVNNK